MRRAWPVVLALCACEGSMEEPSSFLALERDFAEYRSWEFVDAYAPLLEGAEGEGHVPESRRVFVNRRPPEGATSWPVGTVFVKELAGETLASVKRGGSYNATGTPGWEWFELVRDANDAVRISWRGLGAPAGTGRYSQTTNSCNGCHASAPELDGVLSLGFRLGR